MCPLQRKLAARPLIPYIPSMLRLCAAFLTLLSCTLSAADWPEFLGPARDNTSPETGLLDAFPPAGPPVLWSREVGPGYSAPSVRGELLVFHHRQAGEEIVEAADAATGKTRWTYRYASSFTDPFGYNNGPRATPLLTQDRCYTVGAEGVLLCLELTTGKLVWRRDTGRDFTVSESFFGVGSSPVLDGDRLLLQVGGQPDAAVVAFDAATGKTLWQAGGAATWNGVRMTGWPGERTVQWNPGDPVYEKQASYSTPVVATIHGRRHLLCVTRQGLLSLDPATGAAQFAFWFRARQDSSVNAMTPIVDGDRIFISSAYYKTGSVLLKVAPDGKAVEEVWRGLSLEVHWSRPLKVGSFLYAFPGRDEPDARFRCVEYATGKLRWDRPEGFSKGGQGPKVFGRASAILADGKIIALGEGGLLGLFRPNPDKLEEVSRWAVPGVEHPAWAGPVLSARRLFLRSENRLVSLDMAAKGS